MKTVLDQNTVLYQVLDASTTLKSSLSGEIYKGERPDNSILEDVVINSVVLTTGSIQKGVANVNLHVPNLAGVQGSTIQGRPNYGRFEELTEIITPLIGDVYEDEYYLTLENTSLIKDDNGQHYMNYRVRFQFENPH